MGGRCALDRADFPVRRHLRREEDKRRRVLLLHDCEVPVVQRCDFGEPQALCDGDHGGIDHAKREIYVSLHKLGHAADVLLLEFGDLETVAAE